METPPAAAAHGRVRRSRLGGEQAPGPGEEGVEGLELRPTGAGGTGPVRLALPILGPPPTLP